jgi:DNA-binding transcriptional MocR family regulator
VSAAAALPGGRSGPDLLRPAYLGPDSVQARFAEQQARAAGLSLVRSKVVGNIASTKDLWAFRSSIAKQVGCSIRTVARALKQAVEEGLIRVHRGKRDEVPPAAKAPIPCGWSHRWFVARGLAAAAAVAAVAAAKLAAVARQAVQPQKHHQPRARPERRRWTADELDAALAASPVGKPPDVPDPG